MAISHATDSISSNWKSMKSNWDLSQEVTGLSLEDSLLSSPVYQRVSQHELEGSSISQGLPNLKPDSPNRNTRRTVSKFAVGSRYYSEPLSKQGPSVGDSWGILENCLDHSPNASVPPSIATETDRTIGQESHIHLLPTRQISEISDLPSGLIAVQPGLIPYNQSSLHNVHTGLMPVEQAGLISVESKHDARNGLISANQNRLLPPEESNTATSTQSLILSLGWILAFRSSNGANLV